MYTAEHVYTLKMRNSKINFTAKMYLHTQSINHEIVVIECKTELISIDVKKDKVIFAPNNGKRITISEIILDVFLFLFSIIRKAFTSLCVQKVLHLFELWLHNERPFLETPFRRCKNS